MVCPCRIRWPIPPCETLTGPITTRPFPVMQQLLRSSGSVLHGNEPSAEQRLTTYHVKVIRETEAAKNAFRKDPTPANALRLCNAMDGLPPPDTEGSLTP